MDAPPDEMEYCDTPRINNEWRALCNSQTMCNLPPRKLYETALKYPFKNRYPDVLPNEKSRVVLQCSDNEDGYINASHVNSADNRYISCQGPLPATFNDFWQMVWEQKVTVIIMLTKLVEKRRVKAHCYWPSLDCDTQLFNSISVKLDSVTEEDQLIQRHFTLTHGDKVRRLCHIQYTGWPDFGVPPSTESIRRIYELMDKYRHEYKVNRKPTVVVHCSAGIGRSGTFLAIQFFRESFLKCEPNIPAIVSSLRVHRSGMVQTKEQYRYIYKVVEDLLKTHLFVSRKSPSAQTQSCPNFTFIAPVPAIPKNPVVRATPNGRKALTQACNGIPVPRCINVN